MEINKSIEVSKYFVFFPQIKSVKKKVKPFRKKVVKVRPRLNGGIFDEIR